MKNDIEWNLKHLLYDIFDNYQQFKEIFLQNWEVDEESEKNPKIKFLSTCLERAFIDSRYAELV